MATHWQLRRENWFLPPAGAIMGIINTTPDSFSDGGCFVGIEAALAQAERLLQEGAHILDIGGESTRPGSEEVALDEELRRTIPLIEALRAKYPQVRLSIDTRHAPVAEAALAAGADILNDVSGFGDVRMRELAAQSGAGLILMHMQGLPRTMQENPHYEDLLGEVRSFFAERVLSLMQQGVKPACICLDPGIGFGKTTEHNLALIRHLPALREHELLRELPLMMALSRKRFMGEILGDAVAGRGTVPTVVMSLLSAQAGAELHRVHEVAPLAQALRLASRV